MYLAGDKVQGADLDKDEYAGSQQYGQRDEFIGNAACLHDRDDAWICERGIDPTGHLPATDHSHDRQTWR